VALVVGAVVLIIVLALLTFLSLLLRDTRRGMGEVTAMAGRLRADAIAEDLRATAVQLQELRQELALHEEALGEP